MKLCPECNTRMSCNNSRTSTVTEFVRRCYKCPNCKHKLTSIEIFVYDKNETKFISNKLEFALELTRKQYKLLLSMYENLFESKESTDNENS